MTTNNLTEQWKKGELPRGEYYVENNDGVIGSLYNLDNNGWYNIKEVLAPVPSWEQWQQMKAFCEEFNALNVAEENQQLKELLKDCSEFLYEVLIGTQFKLSFKLESGIRKKYYMMCLSELKTKIDNAIGEKK